MYSKKEYKKYKVGKVFRIKNKTWSDDYRCEYVMISIMISDLFGYFNYIDDQDGIPQEFWVGEVISDWEEVDGYQCQ